MIVSEGGSATTGFKLVLGGRRGATVERAESRP